MAAAVALALLGVASTASASSHNNGGGANQSGPFDPSAPGPNDENQGNGNSPDNGSVGKADGKNPPGQVNNTHDRGYECAANKGVGDKGGNPAHTGCSTGPNPPEPPNPPNPPNGPEGPDVLGTSKTFGGASGESPAGSAPAAAVAGAAANADVPTVVAAGSGVDGGSDTRVLIGAAGLMILAAGAALLLAPRRLRAES